MDKFLSYFENEKFIRWVYDPDPELNSYWETWFSIHPEEKKEAESVRLMLLYFKPCEEKTAEDEVSKLFSNIIAKTRNTTPSNYRRLLVPFMRYAAIALIFFSLGIFLTYQLNNNPSTVWDLAMSPIQESSETQIMLADGRQILLHSKESMVEHQNAGKIIIDNIDTIRSNSHPAESEMNQLIVPFGKNSSVRLSDGTLAHLNAGSRLIYPSIFVQKNREVFLIGEGYFEVAHNPERPFIVKTPDLNIIALGTVFNVLAYPSDKIIETTLVEGRVELRDNTFQIFKKSFPLKPNEQATFNRETLKTTARPVDVNEYVAWHEGVLNFHSTDLSRIIPKIERYYNIQIILNNPSLATRSISGKLVLKENKENVMEVLASTARVELTKINETTFGLK